MLIARERCLKHRDFQRASSLNVNSMCEPRATKKVTVRTPVANKGLEAPLRDRVPEEAIFWKLANLSMLDGSTRQLSIRRTDEKNIKCFRDPKLCSHAFDKKTDPGV